MPRFLPFYQRLPYQLWSAVNIKLQAPDPLDPGQLIMYWRGINLIIELFKQRRPKVINIILEGQWHKDGKMNISIPELTEDAEVGDLGLLIKFFGCLFNEEQEGPIITLGQPFASYCITWYSKWIISAKKIKNTGCPVSIEDNLERSQHGSCYVLDDSRAQGRTHAMLDYYLDELPGETAWDIRLCRWIRWDGEYERKAIDNITLLADHEILFSALAERWAVWKYIDWNADKIMHNPEIDPNERRPQPFNDKYCWATRGLFSSNPQRGDGYWNGYKYKGLFYLHNILITPQGVRWEALDWSEWGDDDDILHRLSTPTRPRITDITTTLTEPTVDTSSVTSSEGSMEACGL